MYAMSRTHRNENELLTDLLDWERMYALRNAAGHVQTKVKEPIKNVEPRRSQTTSSGRDNGKSWRRSTPVAGISEETQGKANDDAERGSCFYCHKVGQPVVQWVGLSNDGPTFVIS